MQALVAEQVAHYRARAPDYDNDIAGLHPDWSQAIDKLPIAGDVLELACGSGHWTRLLAARARSVTAIDAAPEMLALARQRVGNLPVAFIQARSRVRPMGSSPQDVSPCCMANSAAAARVETPILA